MYLAIVSVLTSWLALEACFFHLLLDYPMHIAKCTQIHSTYLVVFIHSTYLVVFIHSTYLVVFIHSTYLVVFIHSTYLVVFIGGTIMCFSLW